MKDVLQREAGSVMSVQRHQRLQEEEEEEEEGRVSTVHFLSLHETREGQFMSYRAEQSIDLVRAVQP